MSFEVDITPEDILTALRRPENFAYFGDLPLFKTWALGPVIRNRYRTTSIDEANARVLVAKLERMKKPKDWRVQPMGAWGEANAVDHLSYKVLNEDGTPSEVFKVIKGFYDDLDVYPIADENVHEEVCREQQEEAWLSIYEDAFLKCLSSRLMAGVPEESLAYEALTGVLQALKDNGGLQGLLETIGERLGIDWEEDNSGWHYAYEQVVDHITAKDLARVYTLWSD